MLVIHSAGMPKIFRISATDSGQIPKAIWLFVELEPNLVERLKDSIVMELMCDGWDVA
jgi:hypothetical protein